MKTENLRVGVMGGLAGSVVFGLLMGMMGMGVQFANAPSAQNLLSLMRHPIYGAVLGLTYAALASRRVIARSLTP
ncbi:hypothetical protein DAETH_38940 (plasmid) [Deinococcus aetherius]|uniref:Uncharacterized protein n=1 Tax=Deinococcus aetherius TaxID=200252 RepID=A0ABM8AJC9_9DEIO|nr:hypothetical protein [Deinococcus aetherius]BDP43925.1 hypothetical protein DAETH_38940 [Deinococcus aetherius]